MKSTNSLYLSRDKSYLNTHQLSVDKWLTDKGKGVKMSQKKRTIKVKPRYRAHPDVRRLTRALLALAEADAERAAQEQRERQRGLDQQETAS